MWVKLYLLNSMKRKERLVEGCGFVEQHPCWVSDQGLTKVMVKLHRGGCYAICEAPQTGWVKLYLLNSMKREMSAVGKGERCTEIV